MTVSIKERGSDGRKNLEGRESTAQTSSQLAASLQMGFVHSVSVLTVVVKLLLILLSDYSGSNSSWGDPLTWNHPTQGSRPLCSPLVLALLLKKEVTSG